MTLRAWVWTIALFAGALPAGAHVGSPDGHAEARVAGVHVLASVVLPRAVPGEAKAQIAVLDDAPPADLVVEFRQIPPQGEEHAPAWSPAVPEDATGKRFTAPMPLIVFGLFEAEFRVRSALGEGSIRVPVSATNPRPLRMKNGLVVALASLTGLLVVSAFAVGQVTARDAARPADRKMSREERRRGRIAGGAASIGFLAFIAFTLWTWRGMHRSFEAATAPHVVTDWIVRNGAPRVGRPVDAMVTLVGRDGQPAQGLLDHGGEAVHLTVVSMPTMDHFVHVHGRRTPSGAFSVAWTPRVIGRHLVLADFATREAGMMTIVEDLVVGPAVGDLPPLALAAVAVEGPFLPPAGEAAPSEAVELLPGWNIELIDPDEAAVARDVQRLELELTPTEPATPRPDLARAELTVLRQDAQVYDRLLPAQLSLDDGRADDKGKRVLRFAYAFPQAGNYRLVLHLPDGREVRGAAFDVEVTAAPRS